MPASTALQSAPTASVGFKNLLIATDFSDLSDNALCHGLGLARRYHAHVRFVSVVSSLGFAMAGPEAVNTAVQLGMTEAKSAMQKLQRQHLLENVTSDLDVEYGTDVAAVLLAAIDKHRPDLVVLGTHGRTGLRKLWMGSVAETVFRHSQCPVLTVGPEAEPPNSRKLRPAMIFPTDFSPESVHALPGCLKLAESLNWELTLLHVAPPLAGDARSDWGRVVNGLRHKLVDLLPLERKVIVHCRIEFGDVSRELSAVAAEIGASCIVLGLHSSTGLLEGRWQHAYQIVSHATCPVLTVRTRS